MSYGFRRGCLLTLTAILLLCSSGFGPAAPAQERKARTLKQSPFKPGRQSPVEILAIKRGPETIEPGRPFAADDDWVRGLTFALKNVSGRPLSYVVIGLRFRTPEGSPAKYATHELRYGRAPLPANEAFAPPSPPEAIAPGATFELAVTESSYGFLQGLLTHAGIAGGGVEAAEYDIEAVAFADDADTTWRHGYLLRRDATDPRRFNVVEPYALPTKQDQ